MRNGIGKFLLCAGAFALGLAPQMASAQLDHLVCYKALDRLQVAAAFDMFAELQPEFSARNCKIVKVDDFCVPATKKNVQPPAADLRADIAGPALNVDYIGYLVRCDEQVPPPNKVVIDQFGTHRQGRYKLTKVYVPAKKGPPPCGTVDGKSCGGTCPASTDQCRIDADGTCNCVPAEDNICGGRPDKQGMCGGPCPDPLLPQCQLTLSATGAKICACGPPPPPRCGINAATGTCGGECPNKADKCELRSDNECTCVPASTPCALVAGVTPPTCGGDCPIAGDVCSLDTTNKCVCGAPTPTPCDQNTTTGACGGECPSGLKCTLDTTNHCNCSPLPCGSDATGQCTIGACPDATQQCKLDASGACNCDPPSCGPQDGGTCGGLCPQGATCAEFRLSDGTLRCRCTATTP